MPRRPGPSPGFGDRLRAQCRLIVCEKRTRIADVRLGYGRVLLERIPHTELLSATFAVLTHGSRRWKRIFPVRYTGPIRIRQQGLAHCIRMGIITMTNPALAALTQRRADIAGLIAIKEKEIEELRADLIHLDRSIQMLDPDADPEDTPSRQRFPRQSRWFARGEVTRIISRVLREAAEPVSAAVIVESAMRQRGFDPERDRKLRQDFYKRFIVQLNALRRRAHVEAVGRSKGVKWRLAPTDMPDAGSRTN